jgi:hypothetical protein
MHSWCHQLHITVKNAIIIQTKFTNNLSKMSLKNLYLSKLHERMTFSQAGHDNYGVTNSYI